VHGEIARADEDGQRARSLGEDFDPVGRQRGFLAMQICRP